MTLKLFIKKCIASFFQLSGVLDRKRKKSQAIALMYHRFMTYIPIDCFVQPGMFVYADTFERHLLILRNKFNLVSLTDLIRRIEIGQSTTGCCILTFDDGWLDNYTNAFPILKKYNLPATIFLATDYIGTDRYFWTEEILYYLYKIDDVHISESDLLQRLFVEMTIKKKSNSFFEQAVEKLKKWNPTEREKLLIQLRKNWQNLKPERQMMNWDEVKEMYKSGLITFGAHTANHVLLDQVQPAVAEREILKSRDEIKKRLGIVPELFAYPNGNYTPVIKELIKKHGFRGAVTTNRGRIGNDVDLFEVPRIGMHEDISNTKPMFLARMMLRGF